MIEKLYRSLLRIRRTEEEIARVYSSDKIQSPVHLSIGQEAISVGICEAMERRDVVFGTYRCHAMYLAKGGDLREMIAELYGKVTGCARGKAGSMHLIDVSTGVMGASAVVGTTIPQAVGYAWAIQQLGDGRVVVCFLGDGAAEEGVFHESLNFAALHKLPILFVCENNGYAIHSRQHVRQNKADICALVEAHGIEARRFETMDVEQLHTEARQTFASMRSGSGPKFWECQCYRWLEHVGPGEDFTAGYRSRTEAQPWFDCDPLTVLAKSIAEDRRRQIDEEVELEIRDAFEFAERSPFPPSEELYTDLYAEA